MSGILPSNLINTATSEFNAANDIDPDITNSQILHRFWKVHAIQSDYVQDAASARSRNLFWRVWSSPHLSQSITSARLHSLWQQFSRNVDLSPIHIDPAFWRRQERIRDSSIPVINDPPTYPDEQAIREDVDEDTQKIPALNPHIAPDAKLSIRNRSDETSASTSNTTSDSSSRPSLRRNTSGSKTKPNNVVPNNKGKPRPLIARRKSSQSKAQQINPPRSPKPAIKSPRKENLIMTEASGTKNQTEKLSGPIFPLPSASSWEDEPTAGRSVPSEPALDPTASLVDRDFRERFVENQRQMNSATNLPALGRIGKTGSVVRFADDVIDDMRKGKEREQALSVPDKIASTTLRRSSLGNEAVSDASDSDELTLPRTRSSLSLMINDMRKQSGGQDVRPEPLSREAQTRARDARNKEEELLSMGRKAGAPSIHKISSNEEHQYRPPSPGPLF